MFDALQRQQMAPGSSLMVLAESAISTSRMVGKIRAALDPAGRVLVDILPASWPGLMEWTEIGNSAYAEQAQVSGFVDPTQSWS